MNIKNSAAMLQPMIIFWIGVITGALVVGLIFAYRFINPSDYNSSLLTAPGSVSSPYEVLGPDPTPWKTR